MRTLLFALMLVAPFALCAEHSPRGDKDERHGACEGLVTNVEARGAFTIRSLKGEFTFVPRWVGGLPKDGGGPDRDMVAKILDLQFGDYVGVEWEKDEHLRVVALKVIKRAHGDRAERREERREDQNKERQAEVDKEKSAILDGPGPAERDGVVRGQVISVDPNGRVVVKTAAGEETFVPEWKGGMPGDGGGFDAEMLGKIAKLKTGQQVEIAWKWDERKRVVALKP